MAELQYRNRSISQLVSELNHLGEPNVLLVPLRLTAVHEKDIPDVKRFKNSHGDQFFIPKNSEKKFPYSEIVQSITSSQLAAMKEHFERGFNVSMIFSQPREQGRLTQLLSEIAKVVGNCACSSIWFQQQSIYDSVTGNKLTERDIQNRLKYYRVVESNLIAFLDRMLRGQSKGSITLVKLRALQSSNTPTPNEINLISFPQQFFSPSLKSNDFLSLCKSQLSQIFNYIKLNPANKYQHFSKLLTKRMPVTNILASLVLQETASVVINWMSEGGPAVIHQRLVFYDKMRDLSVLLKKENGFVPVVSDLPSNFHIARQDRSNKSQEKFASRTDRTPIAAFDEENQLDYCRSLQRKTHKYSINDIQLFDVKNESPLEEESDFRVTSNTPSPVTHLPAYDRQTSRQREKNTSRENQVKRFDETMPRKPNIDNIRESEQVAILKSNHAIQISQYHQTIQQLNRKVLALMKDNNLEELYTIHQREIMLLQLKIKELRNDITILSNSPEDKSYKAMVRKLNEEIKRLEGKSSEQKVANGKTAVLEKQLAEIRRKYDESETARKKLTFQLEHLTKRLKICDMEIAHINNQEIDVKVVQKNNAESGPANTLLSLKDDESLKQIQILIKSIEQGNPQSKGYLLRKITNILTDLSSSRNIILQCNDFLIQLEEHLQEKLGSKQPQIVLDCNKFIRNFLMDNMNIF